MKVSKFNVLAICGFIFFLTSANISIAASDLIVSDISIPVSQIVYGQQPWTWVSFTVKNVGTDSVADVPIYGRIVNATLDGEPLDRSGYFYIRYPSPLEPNQETTYEFAIGHDSGWPVGMYTLQVEIDFDNRIEESNENNNISEVISFDVVENPIPDLIVSDISIPVSKIVYGRQPWTWVNFTVKNIGTESVADIPIYGRIVNATLNGEPLDRTGYFYIRYPSPLEQNQETTYSFAVGHDTYWPAGVYTLQVEIDFENMIQESYENNNISEVISFEVVDNPIPGCGAW